MEARPANTMTDEEKAYHLCRDRDALHHVDGSGRTLLHTAARAGQTAICRIYMNAGLNAAATDNVGLTPADLAQAAGYGSLARTLASAAARSLTRGTEITASSPGSLLDAREQRGLIAGESAIVDGIVSSARVTACNAKGDTPLHLAAAGGHLNLCSRLFDAGADSTTRNNAGQTPGEMAAEAGYDQLAALLSGRIVTTFPINLQEPVEVLNTPVEADALPVQDHDDFAQIDFEAEDDPVEFHSRQGLVAVSATFVAIPLGNEINSDGAGDNSDWDLPDALATVRPADPFAGTRSSGSANPELADFSYSSRHTTRRPPKLRNTNFKLASRTARLWVREVLANGVADDLAIRTLIGECHGNHSPADLEVNIRRILQHAGVAITRHLTAFDQFMPPMEPFVDAEELVAAICAACNRDTPVPGRKAFDVDRSSEAKLIGEIANARHHLLNAILDNRHLLSGIVVMGEQVVAGVFPPEGFTDSDIHLAEDDHAKSEFAASVELLRTARDAGLEASGRVRRRALEALDILDISRTCLEALAKDAGIGPELHRLLANCDRSTERFVLAHLPFARRETAKMAAPGEDPEELFQEAYFAIRRAAERFDPDRGARFYMYASFWIRQRVSRWRRDNGSLIRVPVHRYELHEKILSFVEEFEQINLRAPTKAEISEALECDVRTIESLQMALSEPLEYYRAMAGRADLAPSPEDAVSERQSLRLLKEELTELDQRQQDIIRMRFGIDRPGDMTLEEIGEIYGVTRERIRQIEAKSLQRLAHPARARFLRELL